MNKFKLPFLLAAIVTLAMGCDQAPVFPVEPQIEFLDISPKEVRNLRDSVVVRFRFQDGDGDLGRDNNAENDLLLIDTRHEDVAGLSRQDATIGYSLMLLTPDARKPAIQGEISVTIPVVAVLPLPGNTEDDVRYQIELRDRAGNLAKGIDGSEVVYTDYIRVYK